VPEELKQGRFWVCCDAGKIPLVAGERYRASSTDPATWRPYDEAVAALGAYPQRYAGVGRVIRDEDPYVGVDLDGVRSPDTGELSSWATEILEALDSYSEVSPSGEGVKVWLRGSLNRSYIKPGLEVYQRGRYFTATGQFLSQYPASIQERQAAVEELVEREFPANARQRQKTSFKQASLAKPGEGIALVEFLDGVHVVGEEVPDGLGVKFRISCPWAHEHSTDDETGTYLGQRADGGLWFQCWHAHCANRGWTEFRQAVRLATKKLKLIEKGVYE